VLPLAKTGCIFANLVRFADYVELFMRGHIAQNVASVWSRTAGTGNALGVIMNSPEGKWPI
jgi:hypothetical protein